MDGRKGQDGAGRATQVAIFSSLDYFSKVIGVSVGSSIQIAVGVIPLLVTIGWAMGRDLTLYFEVRAELYTFAIWY